MLENNIKKKKNANLDLKFETIYQNFSKRKQYKKEKKEKWKNGKKL